MIRRVSVSARRPLILCAGGSDASSTPVASGSEWVEVKSQESEVSVLLATLLLSSALTTHGDAIVDQEFRTGMMLGSPVEFQLLLKVRKYCVGLEPYSICRTQINILELRKAWAGFANICTYREYHLRGNHVIKFL